MTTANTLSSRRKTVSQRVSKVLIKFRKKKLVTNLNFKLPPEMDNLYKTVIEIITYC